MAPDTQAVDVLIDGQRVIPALPYRAASAYVAVAPGAHTLQLAPSGQDQTVLLSTPLNATAGQDQTIVALGRAADLSALVLNDDNQAPPPNKASVRFIHAGADVPAVDIAATGSAGPPLFSNVAFRGVAGPVTIDAGTYDLELRATGTKNVLLSLPSVSFQPGTVVSVFGAGLRSDNSLTAVQVPYPVSGTQSAAPVAAGQSAPSGGTAIASQMPLSGSGGPASDRNRTGLMAITLGVALLLTGFVCLRQEARH
jgi:hypothetical protein